MTCPLLRKIVTALCTGALLTSAVDGSAAEPKRPTLTRGGGDVERGLTSAGPDGAEYRLPGGAVVRAAPGTRFKLFGAPQELSLRPGPKIPTWSITLKSGRIDVDVPARPDPSAVLVVASKRSGGIAISGRMTVLADARGVLVVNRDGDALAGTADRWQPLAPGLQRAFSAADPNDRAAPGPIVATPTLAPLPSIWFAEGGSLDLSGIEWAPVANAAAYVLELSSEQADVQVRRTSATRLERGFANLSPGAYRLRIGAYDARGIESGWSQPAVLQVVDRELPPGAYTDQDGVIHLAPGQRVQLNPVGGLEMSYTGKAPFIGAADSFEVIRDQPRTIWFRPRGSDAAEPLRLAPRRLRADIELGPRKAVWPRDSVTVRVRLKDAQGKPPPGWLKPVTKVSVGLTPVDVSWRRERDTLFATVPAPATPGPWVVRVEVLDQYEIPLGYDFLEVASAAPRAGSRPLSTP